LAIVKSKLLKQLQKNYPNFLKKDLEKFTNIIFNEIKKTLKRGERIELRGFGVFSTKIQKSRISRNPKTGEKVNTPEKAKEMRDEFGLDGAMIGRASIGNPWFFDQVKHYLKTGDKKQEPTIAERAEMAIRHLKMSVEWKGEVLGVLETRRHYGNYFKGIANFKDTKSRILNEKDPETIIKELEGVKKNFSEAVLY